MPRDQHTFNYKYDICYTILFDPVNVSTYYIFINIFIIVSRSMYRREWAASRIKSLLMTARTVPSGWMVICKIEQNHEKIYVDTFY